jgi:hypothetical protein
MNEYDEIVEHLLNNGCEILSDRSAKHSVWMNTMDTSLKSALYKQQVLTDKYVKNVCRCLGIPNPVLIDIRTPD